jgi:nickel-dependent lactate racemase
MELRLAYGTAGLTVEVPEGMEVDRYGLTAAAAPLTGTAFARKWSDAGLSRLSGDGGVLVVVNDGYRGTPTARLLSWLDQVDDGLLDSAEFLIATGTHPAPTNEHLQSVFGPHLQRVRARVSWHSSTDRTEMTRVGRDRFGEEVFVNGRLLEAATVLVIGSVEPHYFAGFTGGRKSLFPGLADRATIERNHNLANSLAAAPLRLEGNPVAEHLAELARMVQIKRLVSIQIVADASGEIVDVAIGDLEGSFRTAVRDAERLYAHRVTTLYDVVIATMNPPLDRNLYQAQKALENTQAAVRDGGACVVVSPCTEGVGSESFFDLAAQWDRSTNRAHDGVMRFGSHKLSRVNAMTRRIDVRIHSDLSPDRVRRVFYEPAEDLTGLLAERFRGGDRRLALVHDAGHTVLQTTEVS